MRFFALFAAFIILPTLWVGTVARAYFADSSAATGIITAADEFGDIHQTNFVYFAGIDTNVDETPANEPAFVGSVEPCISVESGQTFQIDVVIRANIGSVYGIAGFQFWLRGEGPAQQIIAADPYQLLDSGGESVFVDFSDTPPKSTQAWFSAIADFGRNEERTDGVLTRLTIQVQTSGLTRLYLDDLQVVGPTIDRTEILFTGVWTTLQDAYIAVDEPCPDATPAPHTIAPSPTSSPTLTLSPTATTSAAPSPTSTGLGPTPTRTATPIPTASPTSTDPTPTPHPTLTPTPTPTATATPTPTPILTPTPTITPTPTPPPTATVGGETATPQPTLAGDANCNGVVDAHDAVTLLLNLGMGTPLPCSSAADVTCDGELTPADLMAILDWLGGLPVTLPNGCPDIATS